MGVLGLRTPRGAAPRPGSQKALGRALDTASSCECTPILLKMPSSAPAHHARTSPIAVVVFALTCFFVEASPSDRVSEAPSPEMEDESCPSPSR